MYQGITKAVEAGCVGDQPGAVASIKVVEGQGVDQGLLDGIEGIVMIGQPAEGDAFLEEIIEDTGKGREVRNELLELVAKAKEAPDGTNVVGMGKSMMALRSFGLGLTLDNDTM